MHKDAGFGERGKRRQNYRSKKSCRNRVTWEKWTEENKTCWIQSGFLVQIAHPGDKVPRVTDSSPEQLNFILKRKQLWKTLPLIVLKIKRFEVFKAIRMMPGDSHSQVNRISQ